MQYPDTLEIIQNLIINRYLDKETQHPVHNVFADHFRETL